LSPPLKTVGTVSENVSRSPIVRDMNAIREANDSSPCGKAITRIYSLLNRAGAAKDATTGAVVIRARLPVLVGIFERSYPSTKAKILRLRLRTQGGRAIRQMDLQLLERWSRELTRFRDDVASSSITWFAVTRFGKRNNASVASLTKTIRGIITKLPPEQRKSVLLAVQQMFGTQ
jgi:hypothetical protein